MGYSRLIVATLLCLVAAQTIAVDASLQAATSAPAGSKLEIRWTGAGAQGDFISVDAPGSSEQTYGPYAYPTSGNPVVVTLPEKAGDYVIRYHLATGYGVVASTPLTITAVAATLKAAPTVAIGGELAVTWTGPGHAGDFISIDPVGADDRTYGNYAYPDSAKGSEVMVRAPDAAGDYVLRYHLAASYRVIGSTPLRITPATASLSSPADVVAGKVFEVGWKGPDNDGDFITVVESGAAEHLYGGSNGYTRRGNPVRIEAPRTAGDYELRYLTGQSYTTLATAKLHVNPGTAPGLLTVVSTSPEAVGTYAAVEFLLDASGSMLQRIGGERRIELAKKALVDLTSNVLPANADFALRVFGNKEAGTCRTDLEIPLATLDRPSAVAHIRTINSMNLAKTPIGASLLLVRQDLAGVKGPVLVVLVTDGEETCDGDPRAAITALRDAGLDVRVNIVGFAVDEVALKETFEAWARLGNGGFFDAQDGAQLQSAIRATLRAAYEVLADGKAVATGTVNGDPIEVPPGSYQVRMLGDHPQDVGTVSIESGMGQELRF